MSGGWLLLPFFLVRFGLLGLWGGREALARAGRFAPMAGGERAAYWVYQAATTGLILSPFFLTVHAMPWGRFAAGAGIYALGLLLLAVSVVDFAGLPGDGFCQKGVYRRSRNPMYVAYFLFFAGCALMMWALVPAIFLLVFQVSAHWVILAEERWCLQQFGTAYRRYMGTVRRYP